METIINENQLKTIAEKYSDKLYKVDGMYSIKTVRAIAKECGIDADMINFMTTKNPLVNLYLVDDCWDLCGSNRYEETYKMANFMMKCKERWNNYGK